MATPRRHRQPERRYPRIEVAEAATGALMVAEDGGIFTFGDVPFHGSLGAHPPDSPVVAVSLRSALIR